MRNTWQLQEAKSKFSDVVKQAILEGPQVVTSRGRNCVVVLSSEKYNNLFKAKTSLRDLFKKAPKIELETARPKDTDREISL